MIEGETGRSCKGLRQEPRNHTKQHERKHSACFVLFRVISWLNPALVVIQAWANLSMNGITTHILDIARGRPAAGVAVVLELQSDQGWHELGRGTTDADGRLRSLLPVDFQFAPGVYRLTFEAGAYFAAQGVEGFYRQVVIGFVVRDATQHYHVPLLVSPFGYSTYRGS